jgi:exo-1,4-beta-D-glucosaminidase
MGNPELHELRLQFVLDGQVSDSSTTKFGMREVIAEMDAAKKRLLFKINGKPILIRGGGWTSDMMVRHDPRRIEQQVRMAQDMGLNTIRLESKLETPDFFELTDRLGRNGTSGMPKTTRWPNIRSATS